MVSVSDIDNILNNGRESVLSTISNVPGNAGLTGVFGLIAIVMIAIIIMNLMKGGEERKEIFGPLAILILAGSMIFGFSTMLISWVALFILGTVLLTKVKQGEWKGCILLILVMYFLGFLVSVNPIMLLIVAVGVSALGYAAKNADFHRVFGRSDGARALKEEGYPVTKERRVLKKLRRIASKGYRWSRDSTLRTAAKLKQRFAQRVLMNEAEQLREAEIVAAGEEISKTLSEQQEQSSRLEEKDSALASQILEYADQLRNYIAGLPKGSVPDDKKKYVLERSREILNQMHSLVKNKLEEETLMQGANKVLEKSMDVIHHSAHEATQLEEHKAVFKEMKKAAMKNIESMRESIKKQTRSLEEDIHQAKKSEAQGEGQRISELKQNQNALADVETKLAGVEAYIIKIDNLLMQINAQEDKRIEKVRQMSEKAKRHSQRLNKYESSFEQEAKQLQAKYKEFEKLMQGAETSTSQLLTVTDKTIEAFQHIVKLTTISLNYHKTELAPLVQDMAAVAQDISHLSKVSQSLTKMYLRLSQANEALTGMAIKVDRDLESEKKLERIWKEEDLTGQLTKKAYKRGKAVVSHIQNGYKKLQEAYSLMQRHVKILTGNEHLMTITRTRTRLALNDAFTLLENRQITLAGQLKKEAEKAEQKESQALRSERTAAAQAR
jgi:hypothetical protein